MFQNPPISLSRGYVMDKIFNNQPSASDIGPGHSPLQMAVQADDVPCWGVLEAIYGNGTSGVQWKLSSNRYTVYWYEEAPKQETQVLSSSFCLNSVLVVRMSQ